MNQIQGGTMIRWMAALFFLSLVPATALAQIRTTEDIEAAGGAAAARALGEKLAAGHASCKAGDHQAALTAYNEIKERLPGAAWIYLFIGTAQRGLEQWDEALASFKTAATIAGAKDAGLRARALFNVAATRERQAGGEPGPSIHWKNAKIAWAEYLDLAKAHPEAKPFPEAAQARIDAIEKRLALWDEYETVRGQAKERGDGND
jgi:tetratricopeptide (TPR) repeat protein